MAKEETRSRKKSRLGKEQHTRQTQNCLIANFAAQRSPAHKRISTLSPLERSEASSRLFKSFLPTAALRSRQRDNKREKEEKTIEGKRKSNEQESHLYKIRLFPLAR